MKFSAQIPRSPKIKISDSIQSFTIMNRSLTPEFVNFNEDSLQTYFYKQNFLTNLVIMDSIASDTIVKTLGDVLFNSDRFDVVIPLERNIYRLLPYNKTPDPLNWSYVENICDQYKTDALIVLENETMRTLTSYKIEKELTDDFFQIYEKYYYASIDFYSRVHWRIYDPKRKEIIIDYKMNGDTLSWDSYENDIQRTFKKLPSIKGAAIETGIQLATEFGNLISPQWSDESRYYYVVDDAEIDESVKLAANGDWDGALQNWLKHMDSGNSIKRSKILLNVALAYEMTGDLTSAIKMAKESQKLYYREVTNLYLKQLLKRASSN